MRDQRTWAFCDVRPDGTITYYGEAGAHRTQARPNVHAVETERWVEEAVAWLGLKGWELGSVMHDDGRTFYLKRSIDSSTADVDALGVGAEATGVSLAEIGIDPEEEPDVPRIDPVRLIEEEFLPD